MMLELAWSSSVIDLMGFVVRLYTRLSNSEANFSQFVLRICLVKWPNLGVSLANRSTKMGLWSLNSKLLTENEKIWVERFSEQRARSIIDL